ncbi:MAG: hypothetical protein ACI89G_002989, partial [Minisyncoccia bacterium]
GRVVRGTIVLSLLGSLLATFSLGSHAAAAPIDNVDALTLAKALTSDPALVVGASYLSRPSVAATAVSTDAFGSMPTNGDSFAVLSTGRAADVLAPNDIGYSGTDFEGGNYSGDTDLDVTVLKIDLAVPVGTNCLTLDFRFYSEEYPEYIGTIYNDAFIAELGDSTWTTAGSLISAPANFAFDPQGQEISINASGVTSMTQEAAYGTTFDGATPLLSAGIKVDPGLQALYLSIFDQGDHALDSTVILDNLTARNDSDCLSGAVPTQPAFDQLVFAGTYVTSGEGSTINGNALAGSYLTTGASATIDGNSVAVAAVTLGAGATVSGNVESGAAITTGPTVTAAQQDLLDEQNFLNGLSPDFEPLPGNIATDVTFTPGVHNVAGLLTLAAGKTTYLDAQGDPNAEFIFNISDYLTFGAGANVVVTNGGSNARVVWNVTGGYVTVGAGAKVVGTVMAYGYVSTGANAVLSGAGASCGGVYSVASYVSIGAYATVGTPGCGPDPLPVQSIVPSAIPSDQGQGAQIPPGGVS